MSTITSNIVTIIYSPISIIHLFEIQRYEMLTVVMTPTIVIITLAMADMMALMPRPIAEKMEPCRIRINI